MIGPDRALAALETALALSDADETLAQLRFQDHQLCRFSDSQVEQHLARRAVA
ncbi:MAG: hypothetical protein HY335_03710, partial [Deinococcus sp.]|nr:hypothetical protein [Deinococcus sp.]